MVVLLVILTFAVLVGFEIIQEQRRAKAAYRERTGNEERSDSAWSRLVAGFKLPEPLHYHRGHTWLHWVSPQECYVGADDFARRLVGTDMRLRLPRIGSYLHQGDDAVHVTRADRGEINLASPVEGEVVSINPRLQKDPGLLHRDPYGLGWLYKVRSRSLGRDVANLLDGTLAERWMEDTWDRFQRRLVVASGSVIQTGGTLVDDLGDRLDPALWQALATEFLDAAPNRPTGR
ncbi:MAG: glycine cleavage system protein H [Candidatus Eisenbacteria bacterium]|uniref:Glycine cleavage system protein H n=1 Tax=Eiseniibacteriota bacterium TaxID=2212470 RepID=A0A956LX75_UNCEI|nr:glycine cleavage system protein H [Candidatus Eisenbacteria bacterium]